MRRPSRIYALFLVCLLLLVFLEFVINQTVCLQGNEAWKMAEVDDDSDWGVDNKRIVDSEGKFSNRVELEQ